ncbi:MAG: thioredoxin [Candidatus Latescibacteria bacterium]|nr:thioredoxin [Candidatus Latescibacterota bacterium]NIO27268.1 thioredoxin [Candidatus Latescibacterota bacterium]NIO54792.1 thioredoxin [Candidatus Latescibacterota bacterium]NIT00875.1 thioredoxin [Candidatus Latescibacterota bacterium]NIT37798.1 thioredoxin [Candidatus Latescibacterota bacterium]
MGEQIEVTDATFEAEVIKSSIPVLIDFWAPWCSPCRIVAPIVEEIATEYAGKIKVGKMNTEDNQQIAAQYGIMSIPTLMIFKDGEVKESVVGAQPKEAITSKIDAVLAG